MKNVRVTVEGITPLLMQSPKGMLRRSVSAVGVKTIPSPEDEAEGYTYRSADGSLYFPTAAFRAAMITAASGRRIGKLSAAKVIQGAVFPASEESPLYHPETGEPLRDYEVDLRRVVVQRQGVVRARPRLNKWMAVVELEYDDEVLTEAILLEVLAQAGNRVGIGGNRPSCPGGRGGSNGRFRVLE